MDARIAFEKPISGVYSEVSFGNTTGNSTWVLFSDDGVDEWIGIFGHSFGHCGMMKVQPLANDCFMIFAGAAIYLVNAKSRKLIESYEDSFLSDAIFDEKRDQLIVADYVRLSGIRSGQVAWRSKRIALDGIHGLTICDDRVLGLAEFYDGQVEPFEFHCETHAITCKQSIGWE